MADLSIDERYEAKKNNDNMASYDAAVALAASSQQDATYGRWVEVVYTDTLKSVINKYDDGLPQPFKNIIQGGSNNSFTPHGSLRLDDSDTWGTSGSFHAKLADKWMVKINLWSDNFNYFEDNLKQNKIDRFDDDSFSGNGDGYTDWINFWLIEEDDYFSLDIDNERSDTAILKVVIEGVVYTVSNPPSSDNEAKVWLKEVWHWNPTYGTIAYVPEKEGPDGVITCPEGWTLNETTQQCEKLLPTCDEGYTWDEEKQECVINVDDDDDDDGGGGGGDYNLPDIPPIDYGLFGIIAIGFVIGGIIFYAVGGSNGR